MVHWNAKDIAAVLRDGVPGWFAPGAMTAAPATESTTDDGRFTLTTAAGQRFLVSVVEMTPADSDEGKGPP